MQFSSIFNGGLSFFDFAGLLQFGRWLRHRSLKPIAAQEWNAAQSMVVG
jgi:hypothetical protein